MLDNVWKTNTGFSSKVRDASEDHSGCSLEYSRPFMLDARYINDFSKALASEVRILLQEVGKLRDERRQLQ